MRLAHAWLFMLIGGGGALAGCTSPTHLHEDFGNSYGVMAESQLLHPDAEVSREAVVGLDGQAARRAVTVYQKSFDKTEAQGGAAADAPPPAAGASPLAGAPPSYSSAATGTSPPPAGMK